MTEDESITAITAGMADGTGLSDIIPKFPDRAFDVGIAESHGVDMMAGMAKTGLKPFATIYSTFLQRAFDQVFQEVSLQKLPVRFCMDRAGLVGGDGAVHHGFLDISYLRGFPNMVLTAVYDEPTLRAALRFMADYHDGPSAVRYPRDSVPAEPIRSEVEPFQLGKAAQLAGGDDVAILGYGFPVNHAMTARAQLEQQGYSVAVYDARFAKTPIVTVEDHAVIGGFGACVLEACNEHGLDARQVHRLGLPDRFIPQGGRGEQQAEAGIDADGIARTVRRLLAEPEAARPAAAMDVSAANRPTPA